MKIVSALLISALLRLLLGTTEAAVVPPNRLPLLLKPDETARPRPFLSCSCRRVCGTLCCSAAVLLFGKMAQVSYMIKDLVPPQCREGIEYTQGGTENNNTWLDLEVSRPLTRFVQEALTTSLSEQIRRENMEKWSGLRAQWCSGGTTSGSAGEGVPQKSCEAALGQVEPLWTARTHQPLSKVAGQMFQLLRSPTAPGMMISIPNNMVSADGSNKPKISARPEFMVVDGGPHTNAGSFSLVGEGPGTYNNYHVGDPTPPIVDSSNAFGLTCLFDYCDQSGALMFGWAGAVVQNFAPCGYRVDGFTDMRAACSGKKDRCGGFPAWYYHSLPNRPFSPNAPNGYGIMDFHDNPELPSIGNRQRLLQRIQKVLVLSADSKNSSRGDHAAAHEREALMVGDFGKEDWLAPFLAREQDEDLRDARGNLPFNEIVLLSGVGATPPSYEPIALRKAHMFVYSFNPERFDWTNEKILEKLKTMFASQRKKIPSLLGNQNMMVEAFFSAEDGGPDCFIGGPEDGGPD